VIELVLRHALGSRYCPVIELDDRLLYRLIPGAEGVHTLSPINGSRRIHYAINSRGFRGRELAPSGGSLRVVVYGDSFIHGEFSRTEDTFAERLKVHLARRLGTNVEVVNAGVAGYGPDQELRRMEGDLPSLQPNLVVVAIYAGNDFGDLVRNKLYRLAGDGGLLEVFAWTRRLGHRLGLASWAGTESASPPRLEALIADWESRATVPMLDRTVDANA